MATNLNTSQRCVPSVLPNVSGLDLVVRGASGTSAPPGWEGSCRNTPHTPHPAEAVWGQCWTLEEEEAGAGPKVVLLSSLCAG